MHSLPGVSISKNVRFEHVFFRTNADGYFRLDQTDRRPVYVINLGEQTGVVSLQSIRQDLLVADDGADLAMLDAVGEALKFVNTLRLGEALPSEVVNGQASWKPEAHHLKTANRRIVAALVKWSEGWEGPITELYDLRQFLSHHVDRRKITQALQRLSAAVDGDGEVRIQPVLMELARELSYIEALREKITRVSRIGRILEDIRRAGGRQANDMHEVAAVLRLFSHMVRTFDDMLSTVDEQILDILAAVSAHETVGKNIRDIRNELRSQLIPWEEPLVQWEDVSEKEVNLAAVASKVSDLYRMLAPLYSPVDEWVRTGSYHEVIGPDRSAESDENIASLAGGDEAEPSRRA